MIVVKIELASAAEEKRFARILKEFSIVDSVSISGTAGTKSYQNPDKSKKVHKGKKNNDVDGKKSEICKTVIEKSDYELEKSIITNFMEIY